MSLRVTEPHCTPRRDPLPGGCMWCLQEAEPERPQIRTRRRADRPDRCGPAYGERGAVSRADRRISRDRRDQRSSRCATRDPEHERSERRIFTSLRGRPSSPYQAQISPFGAGLSAIRYRRSRAALAAVSPDAIMGRGRPATGSRRGTCGLSWPARADVTGTGDGRHGRESWFAAMLDL